MEKDIPKRKMPFFFTLKSLSNKQQFFFYFIETQVEVLENVGTLAAGKCFHSNVFKFSKLSNVFL